MKLAIYRALERALSRLSEWSLDQAHRFAICSDCGRNRYSGEPCRGEKRGPELKVRIEQRGYVLGFKVSKKWLRGLPRLSKRRRDEN